MSTPEPGWYPDPTTAGALRYFDGVAWTGETRTPQAPEPGSRVPLGPTIASAPDASPADAQAASPRRGWLWTMVAAAVLVVVGVVIIVAVRGSTSAFEAAIDSCGVENNSGARIGDAGSSLIIDHQGEDEVAGLTTLQLDCIIDALGTPESVVEQMQTTTAMQGRQTATWADLDASWTYHPDNGLDLIFSEK